MIALLLFVFLAYTAIGETTAQIFGFGFNIPNYNFAFVVDTYRIGVKLHLGLFIVAIIFALIAILWLISGILLLRRKPVGRTLALIAVVPVLIIRIFTIAVSSGGVATQYIIPVLLAVTVVLLVLPATSAALRTGAGGQPAGFGQTGYPQQQAAYPQQQFAPPSQPLPPPPSYPQQQPPGGYQQPPGGMPS